MEEGVELGEGLTALGPQGVRRIQNPRNPLLLGVGGEEKLLPVCISSIQPRTRGSPI